MGTCDLVIIGSVGTYSNQSDGKAAEKFSQFPIFKKIEFTPFQDIGKVLNK